MKPSDNCVFNFSVRQLRLILEKALELGYEANSEGQSIEQATARLGELIDDAFLMTTLHEVVNKGECS